MTRKASSRARSRSFIPSSRPMRSRCPSGSVRCWAHSSRRRGSHGTSASMISRPGGFHARSGGCPARRRATRWASRALLCEATASFSTRTSRSTTRGTGSLPGARGFAARDGLSTRRDALRAPRGPGCVAVYREVVGQGIEPATPSWRSRAEKLVLSPRGFDIVAPRSAPPREEERHRPALERSSRRKARSMADQERSTRREPRFTASLERSTSRRCRLASGKARSTSSLERLAARRCRFSRREERPGPRRCRSTSGRTRSTTRR